MSAANINPAAAAMLTGTWRQRTDAWMKVHGHLKGRREHAAILVREDLRFQIANVAGYFGVPPDLVANVLWMEMVEASWQNTKAFDKTLRAAVAEALGLKT